MRISVVIPAYNAEPYIGRTVDSVLAQTRPAHEVIVVDDGSTDGTEAAVSRYGQEVRYIRQDNNGASAARNTGIEAAQGEWIAFLDADDEWMPEKLQRQAALLARNPELMWTTGNFLLCYCQTQRRVEKLAEERGRALLGGREYFDDFFWAFTQSATGWTGTMLIKKEALQQAGLFRVGQDRSEDHDMWWRVAYRWPAIGYDNEPLAVYHLDVPESISKKYRDTALLNELLERHLRQAEAHGRSAQFRPCAMHMLRHWIHHYMHDERITLVRGLIVEFGDLLPGYYRSVLRLLTIWPRLTLACMPMLTQINRWVGLKI